MNKEQKKELKKEIENLDAVNFNVYYGADIDYKNALPFNIAVEELTSFCVNFLESQKEEIKFNLLEEIKKSLKEFEKELGVLSTTMPKEKLDLTTGYIKGLSDAVDIIKKGI